MFVPDSFGEDLCLEFWILLGLLMLRNSLMLSSVGYWMTLFRDWTSPFPSSVHGRDAVCLLLSGD